MWKAEKSARELFLSGSEVSGCIVHSTYVHRCPRTMTRVPVVRPHTRTPWIEPIGSPVCGWARVFTFSGQGWMCASEYADPSKGLVYREKSLNFRASGQRGKNERPRKEPKVEKGRFVSLFSVSPSLMHCFRCPSFPDAAASSSSSTFFPLTLCSPMVNREKQPATTRRGWATTRYAYIYTQTFA